jgi:hypothetical protein
MRVADVTANAISYVAPEWFRHSSVPEPHFILTSRQRGPRLFDSGAQFRRLRPHINGPLDALANAGIPRSNDQAGHYIFCTGRIQFLN